MTVGEEDLPAGTSRCTLRRDVKGCIGSDVEVPMVKGSITAVRPPDEVWDVVSTAVKASLHAAEHAERARTLGGARASA